MVLIDEVGDVQASRDALAGHPEVTVEHTARLPEGGDVIGLLVGTEIPVGARELDRLPSLRIVAATATGYDHLDLERFRANGIPVANTPGPFSATALAEHALLLMLMLVKRFRQGQQQLANGIFYRSFGEELAGKTLALVGFGARIGRAHV